MPILNSQGVRGWAFKRNWEVAREGGGKSGKCCHGIHGNNSSRNDPTASNTIDKSRWLKMSLGLNKAKATDNPSETYLSLMSR